MVIREIQSLSDLQDLVFEGVTDFTSYGDVKTTCWEDLIGFDYTQACQYAGRWNWFEQHSRGLILNRFGSVVAYPFPKFFNWGEGGRVSHAPLTSVTTKIDGSLGILFRHHGQYRIATRGSFTSDQALWATEFLQQRWIGLNLPADWTLLFEIIYPENRVVVDYGDREDLVLLAGYGRHTGLELSRSIVAQIADEYGFSLVPALDVQSPEDVLRLAETLGYNEEGYVMRFADGQRFKVKGELYKRAHRVKTQCSFKAVLEAVRDGTYEQLIDGIPDAFLTEVKEMHLEIVQQVSLIQFATDGLFSEAPKDDRKTFALWVKEHALEYAPYLFARLDGKPIEPLIYQKAFKDR